MANQTNNSEQITRALVNASRLLLAISQRSISHSQLSIPQYRLLASIEAFGPMNLTQLATYLEVNPSTTQRMAEKLDAMGYLSRATSKDARHAAICSLTDQGNDAIKEILDFRHREIAAIVELMPSCDRAPMVDALREFTEAGGRYFASFPSL